MRTSSVMSVDHSGNLAGEIGAHATIFAALGDETRLAMVARLSKGSPQSITELTEGFNLTRQAITKHLRVLEDAELVVGVRVGRERRYEFKPERIKDIKSYLEQVSQEWELALGRLKSFVEK